jgi:hypothetical protein
VGHFLDAAADPAGHTETGKQAHTWLDKNDFGAITPPILMSYWFSKNVPGATDFFSIISYDALHDFFLGKRLRSFILSTSALLLPESPPPFPVVPFVLQACSLSSWTSSF